MAKRILIAAGGTGGHVFPAVAVAEKLRDAGYTPVFITDQRGKSMIPRDFPSMSILAASPYGDKFVTRLKGMTKLSFGTLQTIAMMLITRPRAIIGFGGYPAVAPVIVGHFMGKPSMLHEQNAFFGRANHFLAKYTKRIALSWGETRNIPSSSQAKTIVTGMPVRDAFEHISTFTPPSSKGDINLLIVGGSLGAAIFGETVPDAIGRLPIELRQRLNITHQVRQEQIAAVTMKYEKAGIRHTIAPFIKNMAEAMEDTHLVIGRAGASSVAELAAAGRPAILVPYPHAMDDHQTANAEAAVEVKGGWLVPEQEMSAGSLAGRIATLISSPETLAETASNIRALNKTNAAKSIAEQVVSLTGDEIALTAIKGEMS